MTFPLTPRLVAATLAIVLSLPPLVRAADNIPSSGRLSYNDHIQPILAENCFACHGPDSSARKGKLRLDAAEFATQPRGDREPAIIPGNPKLSLLVERITATDEDDRMPPSDSHKHLKPEEIALLQRWVAEGATYERHWSLIAPTRPAVSSVRLARGWARNPVDHFIAEKLAETGLKPGREEERARLLRRVTHDLTGLPPTPEELEAFLKDRSRDAYERVVDRLLGTDASAEHFARHWLDAVRYGDTHGIHVDSYRSIWPYRDWVIESFRRNMPFDQFTIEQVAGDLLADATLDQKVASGFNRCLPTTSEGGAIAEEYEAIYAKDRVETLSTVWLGLTTGCASCHDHKFDPITTKDFYALTAFFRNNTMATMDGNRPEPAPTIFVPAPADRPRWSELQREISSVTKALQARARDGEADFATWAADASRLHLPPGEYSLRQHVPFDEAAGSARRRHGGTLPLDGVPRIDGPFGPAPRINDLDLILGDPVPMTRTNEATLALWVRVDGAVSGTLLSCRSDEDPERGWEVFLENGKPGMFVSDGKDGVEIRAVAKQPLTPGAWHHVMLTYDSEAKLYRLVDVHVDGKIVASAGEPRSLRYGLEPTVPLRLGARHGAGGKPSDVLRAGNVWVQDFRYLERSLPPAEGDDFAELRQAFQSLAKPAAERTEAETKALRAHYFAAVDPASLPLARRLDGLRAEEAKLRARGGVTLIMEEKKETPPTAHVLIRGEYSNLGDKVIARTPAALPPLAADAPRNRLGLAQWLVAPENPLTARVTVNRVWQQVFGSGLVESTGDFGITGSRPSHPRLLDWLAVEFRESGWDYRRLVRLLVTSATYRQSAVIPPALLERDPANRLLARGPRHRLDAEALRDQALAASGLLVAKLGGPPVRPYQPEGIWEEVAMKQSTTRYYQEDEGENLYRRSLYTLWKRTAAPPAMEILNAPTREVTCVRRDRTNTPLQALVTLNEPIFVEASRQLAARVMREATKFDARLSGITRRLLSRDFSRTERKVAQRTFDAALATYRQSSDAASALLAVGDSPADESLPRPELAAWTLVASQVMNLDEALTR